MLFALLLAAADDLGTVNKVLRDPLPVFDRQGNEVNRFKVKTLAKSPPWPIVAAGDDDDLGVELNGSPVFLHRSDVSYTLKAAGSCRKLETAARADGRGTAATSVGVKSGAAENSVACIPK